MLCSSVSRLLSEHFDGVLDSDMSVKVSQHLKLCDDCRKQMDRLSFLHSRLNSVERLQAPDYLYRLVQESVANKNRNTWSNRLKDAVEFRWSRIRTTEARFYWTRVLGTLMATLCFCFISISIDPDYTGYSLPSSDRTTNSYEYLQQFNEFMGRKFGRINYEHIETNFSVICRP